MNPDAITYAIGGLCMLLGAFATARASRRTATAETRVREITANAQAAKDAQSTYSGIVADLRTEVNRLHDEVERLRAELNTARHTMNRLTTLLNQHNIQIPQEGT